MTHVDATNETLLQQAPLTANEYLDAAIIAIDARFGDGFARIHPELIAAYMLTCATDAGTAVIARAIASVLERTLTVGFEDTLGVEVMDEVISIKQVQGE